MASETPSPQPDGRPLIIGLTGGIGSGKSAVADFFREHGVPVIDTDEIARQQVEPGMPALVEIAAAFGPDIIAADGQLDRSALGRMVFADPRKREQLEAILHPRIRAASLEQMHRLDAPFCIWVVPLLLETGLDGDVDRVLVVDVPVTLQMQRVMTRDGLPEAEVQRILAAQTSREQRLARADDVVENAGTREALRGQLESLLADYRALAGGP